MKLSAFIVAVFLWVGTANATDIVVGNPDTDDVMCFLGCVRTLHQSYDSSLFGAEEVLITSVSFLQGSDGAQVTGSGEFYSVT